MPLSPKWYTFLTGLFASLGSILFGYDLGVIAEVLPHNDFKRVMGPRIEDPNQVGLVASLLLLGAFFSCPVAGILADRFGRRKAIIAGCVVFLLGGALQTGAQSIDMMMAGRFFAGWGIGNLSMLAPLYQSEIAQPSIRGRLTTLQQFMLGIGAFIASWVSYACFNNYPDIPLGWRLPLGLQIVPCVPLAFCIMLFPESPRWLVLKGRDQEALETLARLHARGDINDPLVRFEHQDIKTAIAQEHSDTNPLRELFGKMHHFRPLLLGIILQFSVQMTGVSAIQYYSPQIFQSVGFDATQTFLWQAYNSIIALAGEVACVLYVDKLGRRWPLIICNLMSSFSFAVGTALIVSYPASSNNTSAHIAFVMMTWIFNFFFSAGIGPISWAYPVEILPTHLRSTGTAITSMAAWISNFMIAQVTPKAFDQVQWRYYLVFCILSFTNAITVWALFPETKGRRLEEMLELWKTSSWFVPSHPPARVDGDVIEAKMREGTVIAGALTEKSERRASADSGKPEAEEVERV